MLKKIILENYRCYDKHEIEFKSVSIVVGKNNAGKSTLVEALRLLSIAVNRYENINYINAPKWTDLPKLSRGFRPSLQGFEFSLQNIFHKYGEPPAKITAFFDGNQRVEILIGPDAQIFVIVFDSEGNIISQKGRDLLGISNINALPQLSPVNPKEKILRKDYVRQNLNTDLSSLHFRNQLYYYNEHYQKFTDISENTWKGLHFRELISDSGEGDELSFMIQDFDFVAEVAWMGHGLQMWLQIMWFLAKVNENDIIILDEPDVYMHPDLQRKLIRFLRGRYKQVIIATHSIEIISEVEPDNILIIDKSKTKSIYANKLPAVQRILNSIGSIHNLQLTKLSTTKKLLIVEGKDIDILKRLQNKIFPNSEEPFDAVPKLSIGGWGGWHFAIGSNMLLKNSIDEEITTYCIFDSDYHTDEEKEERNNEARRRFVQLHIWSKKEIENYLLSSQVIYRLIKKKGKKVNNLTYKGVESKISEICEDLKEDVIDSIASEIQQKNKRIDFKSAKKEAKSKIINLQDMVSGKEVISRLSAWSSDVYKVSLNSKLLAQEFEANEINQEMISIITKIECCIPFIE